MDARTIITVAIIGAVGTIGASFLSALAAIVAAIVTNRARNVVNKAEKSVAEAEKSVVRAEKNIKEISEGLPSLKLLFEHDANGNRLQGSIDDLIEAVLKGHPIKVRIHHSDQEDEVIDAQSLYVDNRVVFASNTSLISTTKDESGDHVYAEPPYHYYVIAGSNGSFHQKRTFIDGTPRNASKIKRHMSWISLIPPS